MLWKPHYVPDLSYLSHVSRDLKHQASETFSWERSLLSGILPIYEFGTIMRALATFKTGIWIKSLLMMYKHGTGTFLFLNFQVVYILYKYIDLKTALSYLTIINRFPPLYGRTIVDMA